MRFPALAAAFSALLSLGAVQAAPTFVNGLTIPGDQVDLSGGTTVNNGRVGFFSDLFYDPNRSQWWGLSAKVVLGSSEDGAAPAAARSLTTPACSASGWM